MIDISSNEFLASKGSKWGFDLIFSTSPGGKCLEHIYVNLLIDSMVNPSLAQRYTHLFEIFGFVLGFGKGMNMTPASAFLDFDLQTP